MCWLEVATDYPSKEDHQAVTGDNGILSLARREHWRFWGMEVNHPALARERPLAPGETHEPFGLC